MNGRLWSPLLGVWRAPRGFIYILWTFFLSSAWYWRPIITLDYSARLVRFRPRCPLTPARGSRRRTCLLLLIRSAFRPCFSSSSSSSSFCRLWACRAVDSAAGMAITSLWAMFATTSTRAATIAMKIPTFAIICKWMCFGPRVNNETRFYLQASRLNRRTDRRF